MKLILLIFLMSCSSPSVKKEGPVPYRNVDVRAMKYVKSFEKYYGKNIPNISIEFKDLTGRAGGVCHTIKGTIKIDEPMWEYKKDEYAKEEVIFHELGHCVLGLGHDYVIKKKSKCPSSIMYYQGASIKGCYKKYRPYYIRELFFRQKNDKKIYNHRLDR